MEARALPRALPGPDRVPAGARGLASDAHLVRMMRAGDERAFDALYHRHHRSLLAFCRHLLGDRHEAEDAVQHTFLAAYRDLAFSAKAISVRPWLFTIARNRCYAILRARRSHLTDEVDVIGTEGLGAEVQRREDLRELVRDMAGLPDEQRAALVLAELEALSHAEIGVVLGVAPQKVKALVFQARASLTAERDAREIPCAQIREELALGRGGALRRGHLRRHLRGCVGCRAVGVALDRQRRGPGLLLPVMPALGLGQAVGVMAALAVSAGTAGTAVVVATGALPFDRLGGAGLSAGPPAQRPGDVAARLPALGPSRSSGSDPGAGHGLGGRLAHPAGSHANGSSTGRFGRGRRAPLWPAENAPVRVPGIGSASGQYVPGLGLPPLAPRATGAAPPLPPRTRPSGATTPSRSSRTQTSGSAHPGAGTGASTGTSGSGSPWTGMGMGTATGAVANFSGSGSLWTATGSRSEGPIGPGSGTSAGTGSTSAGTGSTSTGTGSTSTGPNSPPVPLIPRLLPAPASPTPLAPPSVPGAPSGSTP